MISEFFIGLAQNFIVWIAGLMGTWVPPEVLVDPSSGVRGLLLNMASVGIWVEWGVVTACSIAGSTTYLVVLIIKTVLRIGTHVPAFGGGAT